MKVGSVNSYLYLVGAQQSGRTNKPSGRTMPSLSWVDRVARVARLVLLKGTRRGLEPVPIVAYTAHVDELRACIQVGSYGVDSITLARCILVNETHFLSIHQE